ncbi:unnamed protein product [Wuchereria bancrofti]|uniref:Uncharacterized protein n=1 Tax=Wuchereria bancrofti TaxID=6293 RepID=A0A3P7G051_WUCBA|nr:unnamed protein product [Wuchereria bancrofti]
MMVFPDMISTFSCPQKFFNRHVKRQASFLAAVSANNSHRCKGDKNTYKIDIRSISTCDLQSDVNSSKESLKWQNTDNITHLTPYHTNTMIRSNESSLIPPPKHTSSISNEFKNYSNISQHSSYYISPENNFRNGIRCNNLLDQKEQNVKKFLNIPKISSSDPASNIRRQYQSDNESKNSTTTKLTNLMNKSKIDNISLLSGNSFKINPTASATDRINGVKCATTNISSKKQFSSTNQNSTFLHEREREKENL